MSDIANSVVAEQQSQRQIARRRLKLVSDYEASIINYLNSGEAGGNEERHYLMFSYN